jgi:hypothetical protein
MQTSVDLTPSSKNALCWEKAFLVSWDQCCDQLIVTPSSSFAIRTGGLRTLPRMIGSVEPKITQAQSGISCRRLLASSVSPGCCSPLRCHTRRKEPDDCHRRLWPGVDDTGVSGVQVSPPLPIFSYRICASHCDHQFRAFFRGFWRVGSGRYD